MDTRSARPPVVVVTPPKPLASVAVFCGAASGNDPVYMHTARTLGELLARRSTRLIYGGGRAGLMGAVADGALAHNGQVTGVIPDFLVGRELAHPLVKDMIVTTTMHERKMTMADRANAFIALPGGLGTLDELFEILAWAQLGLHAKPVGILSTKKYYDAVMTFLDHVEREGFLRLNHRTDIVFDEHPEALLDRLTALARP